MTLEEEYRIMNAEAREKGLAEGLEKGLKEGHKESQVEIAKKMLNDGMDIQKVVEYTGLTESAIRSIKTTIK